MGDRDDVLFMAKLAEQSERYDEMQVHQMSAVNRAMVEMTHPRGFIQEIKREIVVQSYPSPGANHFEFQPPPPFFAPPLTQEHMRALVGKGGELSTEERNVSLRL